MFLLLYVKRPCGSHLRLIGFMSSLSLARVVPQNSRVSIALGQKVSSRHTRARREVSHLGYKKESL